MKSTVLPGPPLGQGKRNYRTSIAVAAFSTRARPNGSVAVPLRWEDMSEEYPIVPYSVATLRDELKRWEHDPWQDFWACKQPLPRLAK